MNPFASILLFLFTLTLLPLQAQRPSRPNTPPPTPPPPSESPARNSIDYNRAFSQVKDNRKKAADIVSRLAKQKPSASRDIIRGAIDALRDDPEYVTLLDGLIKSTIAAAPDQLANIVSAAAAASPENARTIVSAAIAITGGAAASQENLTTILNAAIEGAPNRRESIYDAAMDAAPNRVWDPLRFPGQGIDVNTAGVSGRFPDAPPTDLAGNNPPVVEFDVSPASINLGQSATLTWSVSGATSITISPGIGSVGPNGSTSVSPTTTTTYTITATGPGGTVTRQVVVTVNAAPNIVFNVSPAGILADGIADATLSWTVTGATSITIDNGIGTVTATGNTKVKPSSTTTYTLTATGPSGTNTAQVTLTVVPLPPEVITFTGTPIVITAGDSVELAWFVIGADEISINQGVGKVTAVGTTSVTPEPDATEVKTVTYIITATNGTATITEDVTITINPRRPVVDSFSASPSSIDDGGSSTLIWNTTDATSVQIVDDKGGDLSGLAADSTVVVSPTEDTTYTLTASNGNGDTDTRTVTVLVNPPLPEIVVFDFEVFGDPSDGVYRIFWEVRNADTVEITNIGPVPSVGSTLVSPSEDTDYVLTATNSTGSVNSGGRTRQVTRSFRITLRPPSERKPVINSFTTSASTIPADTPVTLSWEISNATSATISPGVGTVNATSGTNSVTPAASTSYTLTATNANGNVIRSVFVTVLPPDAPPIINSFNASPATVLSGETSQLSWSVTNATSVTITGIGGVLNPSSGSVATPALTQSTTYTLEATSESGKKVTQAVRVTVVAPTAPPSIASFTATPSSILTGSSSTLAWSVVNADTVSIDQGIGAVSATGTRSVTPAADTTYTLTATNTAGTVTRTVKVSVAALQPPTIASFVADPAVLTVGESATLRWETKDASFTSISPNVGNVSGSGSTVVVPVAAGTYAYTLLAINKTGAVSRSVSVRVNSPVAPSIVSFTASPAAIVSGDSSILSWQVTNADTVSISPQPGTVSLSGSAGVSPTATQIYTLTATKGTLTTTRQVTVTVTAPAQPPVIASFTASPSTITAGDSTTLSWDIVTDVGSPLTSLSITPSVAVGVSSAGSVTVSPTTNTTYTISAANSAGTVTQSVSVVVDEPDTPPLITSFTASPGSIFQGESSILSWNVDNADSVTISPNVGTSASGNGSFSVSPEVTTIYTLTAFKQGSKGALTSTKQVTITVKLFQPKIQFTASPPVIFEGESSTLSWTVTGADPGTISISPAIGTVEATGTQSASPTVTTTYTITASNAGGVSTSSIIVTVKPRDTTVANPNSNPSS